ncbi:MAG: hypothetical protein GX222_04305 [Ruminococcaceae bacterium]|nr:hypothetical protein [Oscillospiraceae bacterium]
MSGYDADKQLEEILENIKKMREAEQRHREDALLKTAELKRIEEKEAIEKTAELKKIKEEEAMEKAAAEHAESGEELPAETLSETEIKETAVEKTAEEEVKKDVGSEKKKEVFVSKPQRKSDFARALSGDVVEMKTMEVSFEIDEDEEDKTDEAKAPAADPAEHPLFTDTSSFDRAIPKSEDEGEREQRRQELEEKKHEEPERRGVIVEEKFETKGILNLRESVNDEDFKKFFSDTVIIDAKTHTQKRARQRKVTDFVVSENAGGPVFADEPETDTIDEYSSEDQTEYVMERLIDDKQHLSTRVFFTGLFALALLIFNLLIAFDKFSEGFSGNPKMIYGLNVLMMAGVFAFNLSDVIKGFLNLITFKADKRSITSFAVISALIEPIVMFFAAKGDGPFICHAAPIAALTIFFSVYGEKLAAKRVLRGFNNISSDYDKYATVVLEDDPLVRRLTRGLIETDPRVLVKRKTGFTDDYLAHSKSEDTFNPVVSKPASIAFAVSLLAGLIVFLKTGSYAEAISALAMAAALSAPFTATLASELPFGRMQAHLSRIGCVIPGYSAADEVIDSNTALFEGKEIFPRGNVLLHGIKTFERERIDKAILFAASVLIQSCDTMSHMFLNVIQSKTDMLYDVDSIVYEDGLGFSCWIDKTRILIGKRELLESRDIEVPSRDYENRYTKATTRDAIYLAVSGKLYAMFVVSYAASSEVARAMRELEKEGIKVIIRTRDFNITAEKVSNLYSIPRGMVSIVADHDMEELATKTSYATRSPSVMTHIGSFSSYVGGILSCHKLLGSLRLTSVIELAAIIIGALLSLLLAIFGGLSTFSILTALLFHTAWLLITALISYINRY